MRAPDVMDRFVLFYTKRMFRFHGCRVELPSGCFRCSLNYGHHFVADASPGDVVELIAIFFVWKIRGPPVAVHAGIWGQSPCDLGETNGVRAISHPSILTRE